LIEFVLLVILVVTAYMYDSFSSKIRLNYMNMYWPLASVYSSAALLSSEQERFRQKIPV